MAVVLSNRQNKLGGIPPGNGLTGKLPFICGLAAALLPSMEVPAEEIEVDSVLIRLIDQVDIPAQALGPLSELHVEEGSRVDVGQLMAQIDDTEAQLQQQRAKADLEIAELKAADSVALRSARKSLEFAQADFERLRRADQDRPRSVSESELERARLAAEQASLDLERAQNENALAKLEQQLAAADFRLSERNVAIRRIVAPAAGEVVKVVHRPGEWVKPGDQMFRIVRTDRLRAEGFVEATAVLRDLRGTPVKLEPELGSQQRTFAGEIVFVSPEIDPINGQVRVFADVDNAEGWLRPGLRATMTILVE